MAYLTEEKHRQIIDFVKNKLLNATVESWNIGQSVQASKPKWAYESGCMLEAVMGLHCATGEQIYFDFVKRIADQFVNNDGGILGYDPEEYNIDHIKMGKVLFDLHEKTGQEKYKKATELLYSQLQKHPRTKTGNFWHKKIYPNQVWLDGLYMGQPFYIRYEVEFNGGRNISDSLLQFVNVREFMKDKKTGLFYHGYDESRTMFWADKETGLSRHFWSRAIAWYVMALVDCAEILDNAKTGNHSDSNSIERETLKRHLREIVDAMLRYTHNLMFWQVTDKGDMPGNYTETSATCAMSYAIMKGARLKLLPENYFDVGREIFISVVENKLELGDGIFVLKDGCLVSGLGGMRGTGSYKLRDGTYDYYISELRADNELKTVAIFLYAFAEIIRGGCCIPVARV
ncbi:MAG: glycoside hydrolase family 88 protein [Defluviitaleaceae bacterium]|nr:glycoside hydrolase family 88 protein [Defluviitaleaceae bacterium]